MDTNDANDLARWLAGLFPTLTPDQVCYWRDEFERHEAGDVRKAVEQHAREGQYVNPPRLVEAIRNERRKRTGRKDDGESKAVAAQLQEIDAAVTGLSDAQLEAYKAAILPGLSDAQRGLLAKRNPRGSATWRCLIYDRVLKTAPTS